MEGGWQISGTPSKEMRQLARGWRKPGGVKGRGQEEMEFMEFMKTTVREGLITHPLVHLFIYRYLHAHCVPGQRTQWDPSPALRSLVRGTNKQMGDCTTLI